MWFHSVFMKVIFIIYSVCMYSQLFSIKGVAVPVTNLPLSDEDYQQLQQLLDPLAESESYGIDLYRETLQFLQEHAES